MNTLLTSYPNLLYSSFIATIFVLGTIGTLLTILITGDKLVHRYLDRRYWTPAMVCWMSAWVTLLGPVFMVAADHMKGLLS